MDIIEEHESANEGTTTSTQSSKGQNKNRSTDENKRNCNLHDSEDEQR